MMLCDVAGRLFQGGLRLEPFLLGLPAAKAPDPTLELAATLTSFDQHSLQHTTVAIGMFISTLMIAASHITILPAIFTCNDVTKHIRTDIICTTYPTLLHAVHISIQRSLPHRQLEGIEGGLL